MGIDLLLLFVPVSAILAYGMHAPAPWVFATSILAIIPLAEWMRKATEQVAMRAGSTVGGLLNVTFGNLAELIIALFVLSSGSVDVVKAQITGSIIGNSLLGLGLAIVVGGWRREKQAFKPQRASLLSSLLILSVIALLLPAFFDLAETHVGARTRLISDEHVSLGVSIVLILVYFANLVYTLRTHRDVFAFDEQTHADGWPLGKSVGLLLGATLVLSFEAELVSGALEETSKGLGISGFFLGIIVLAIVGNIAEYISAVYFARQNRMGLVITITAGSTIQVALLTAPVLVVASQFMSHRLNLVFDNPLELIGIAATAFAVNSISQDGETTWFEGVLLIAVYVLLAVAFFYL
ncbi:MAG TPA: calcium/proton exchanger [Fimbriimonadaceae bacterium]|nr:calcium/proton exchanger [Fimbriimonadaceae bacterium]